MLRQPGWPGARAGAVDPAFVEDASRASPALLERPAGWRDSGEFRGFPVFGIVEELVAGVFECRGDVVKEHAMHR